MFPDSVPNATRWFVLVLLVMSWTDIGYGQSPPRLLPDALDLQRVVPEGTLVQLPCPVEGDPDTLFFEWYRDREPLDTFADARYRVINSGSLRIKSVIPEDTGLYICKAVNGFGSVEVKVTLLVLGKPDTPVATSSSEDDVIGTYEQTGDNERDSSETHDDDRGSEDMETPHKGKPQLTQVSRFQGSMVQRLVGSSISFKCLAKANPRPQIAWLKNGKPLPDSNLPSNSKKGHWTLYLQNLQVSDTGNYTCLVYNGVGSVSVSYLLQVTDGVRQSPQMVGVHPMNTTVREGDTAVMQCLVKSDVAPHVQWMKEVRDAQLGEESQYDNTIRVQGEYFRVLRSTEVTSRPDGSYLNKLVIETAYTADAGKYICMGANKMGYTFRSAYLTILPRIQEPENESNVSPSNGVAFPVILAVTVTAAVVVAITVFICVKCRGRRNNRPTTPSSRATSSSKASVSTETKNPYSCMAYSPRLGVFEGNVPSVAGRVYIPPNQVQRVEPLAFV